MPWYTKILDTLWPTIEAGKSDEPANRDVLSNGWAPGSDDKVDVLLHELRLLFTEEESRRSRVEAKASGMLVAIGMSVSLGSGFLFAVVRVEFGSTSSKNTALVAFGLAFLALVYLVQGARHALAALERTSYQFVGPEDLVNEYPESAVRLKRRIATEYGLSAVRNRHSTNRKVDFVHLAQCYVRNAIVTVLLAVVASFFVMCQAPVRGLAEPLPPYQVNGCASVPVASTVLWVPPVVLTDQPSFVAGSATEATGEAIPSLTIGTEGSTDERSQ